MTHDLYMYAHRSTAHMLKRLFLLLIPALFFPASAALASHIYGADFYYQYISGTQYRVTLAIYGDCDGENFSKLEGATPTIILYDGNNVYTSRNLNQDGAGVEVTPVCERELSNTSCKDATNPIPGVTRYVYSGIFNVPYASANWRFHFDGAMPSPGNGGGSAGRSYDLCNILNSPTSASVMALDARLNNTNGPNSTAQFTTIPTPFYCINVAQQYNHGAVDPDRDSLSYAIVPGLQRGGSTISYVSPYSGPLPMNGANSSWSFNSQTGQLDFTPTLANKFLVVNEVKEYRNGVLVGTAMREMSFVVLANCNNKPSVSNLDTAGTYKSGVSVKTTEVIICSATGSARFAIVPTNTAGDTITASVTGLPAGATATIYTNNTPRPIIVVRYVNANLAPGQYNFFVTYRDKGCPLTSSQTKAFTIRIVAANVLQGPQIVRPTHCVHKATVQLAAASGMLPRTITVSQGGTTLISYRDTTGLPFRDSLLAGSYTVTIKSDDLDCATQRSILVVDSGEYPHIPTGDDRFHCLGDPSSQLKADFDSGAVLNWYLPNGSRLPGTPVPATDAAGRWLYLVSQQYKTCESKKDSIWVYVTKRPVALISGDALRCEFDTGTYVFAGSIGVGPILQYDWTWGNAFYHVGDGPGPWKTVWGLAGRKLVTLQVQENKCPSNIDTLEVEVKPRPFSGFELNAEACRLDSVFIRYNTAPLDGQQFDWTFTDATLKNAQSEGPFRISWDVPGVKRVTLVTSLDGCQDTRYKEIAIRPTPEVKIANAAGPVCIGDKLYLQATGADSYLWRPMDSMRYDEKGMYAQILKPSGYTVIGSNTWSCKDSARIEYPVVEACCSFGYPNAFTPNGDGRNDVFGAVTYGNHLEYELSIYNRWGQRVFYGHQASQGWDGTFGGKPCEAGTYFYYLKALCFTGHREEEKGDVILIR